MHNCKFTNPMQFAVKAKCQLYGNATPQRLHDNRPEPQNINILQGKLVTLDNITPNQYINIVDSQAAVSPVHNVQLQVYFMSAHQSTISMPTDIVCLTQLLYRI